jgi:hypothetical protein
MGSTSPSYGSWALPVSGDYPILSKQVRLKVAKLNVYDGTTCNASLG